MASSKGGKRSTGASKKQAEEQRLALRHYVRTEGLKFLKDPNITSIGVGYRLKDGVRGDELCLQFTVREKAGPQTTLEDLGDRAIPSEIEVAGFAIPTDVVERDYRPDVRVLRAPQRLDGRRVRRDPVVPGISVSHADGSAGTLGLLVFDQVTGAPCMLSNWHVLHGAGGAVGDAVVQPGPFDDNDTARNRAGVLLRSHLGPAGDCAIARIEEREFDGEIEGLGVTPKRLGDPELDDLVVKSGRTTAVTTGIVRRVDVMVRMSYRGHGDEVIGGFEIGPVPGTAPDFELSLGGDSGSGWLAADSNGDATDIFVGLHFAGESSNNPDEHAIACLASSVVAKLNVSLTAPSVPERRTTGFDPHFLSEEVPLPKLNRRQQRDAVAVDGSKTIEYTHFSLCLSKSRGLSRFVAWNIDGGRLRRISRRGIPFVLDDRVPHEFQHGNELYQDQMMGIHPTAVAR